VGSWVSTILTVSDGDEFWLGFQGFDDLVVAGVREEAPRDLRWDTTKFSSNSRCLDPVGLETAMSSNYNSTRHITYHSSKESPK
jgi:hypothetical protein